LAAFFTGRAGLAAFRATVLALDAGFFAAGLATLAGFFLAAGLAAFFAVFLAATTAIPLYSLRLEGGVL